MKTFLLIITMLFVNINNPTMASDFKTEINSQIESFAKQELLSFFPSFTILTSRVAKIVNYKPRESMAIVIINFANGSISKNTYTSFIKVEHTMKDSNGYFLINDLSRMSGDDFRANPSLKKARSLVAGN